jgi:Rrf2 family protein
MRLELLRKTDLALRALRYLATVDGRAVTGDVAAAIGATPAYVPQVMVPLVRRGWVTSQRGPLGGYELMVDLSRINVRELIEAMEGPIDDRRCVLRNRACDAATPCAIHDAWTQARTALVRELESLSLDSTA